MPDLLIELLTEEIPARMQRAAADDFARIVTRKLAAAGLSFGKADSFVTPRRLALAIEGLPLAQKDVSEERRGPRVGAPPPAVEGFLKSAGLATLAECEERDTGKGHFYFAVIHRPGRATATVLPDLLRAALAELPWPKSMRFPAAEFRWVRPLVSVIALFDGDVLLLTLDNVPVGDETLGHRFLSSGTIKVGDLADYRDKLRAAHVVLDADERQALIADGLARAAAALGVTVKPDDGLLEEVRGLVEWPVVLAGRIDPQFMDLPAEVLTTSMRAHQKYFACLDADGKLAPHFLVVSNMETADGGTAIVAGNERVLRARLSDARFFWDQDRKVKLEDRVPKLADRVYFEGLGSVRDKVERTVALSTRLAELLLRNPKWLTRKWPQKTASPGQNFITTLHEYVQRAMLLAKADLSTGMVGEFPELQGVMGRYYALAEGEPAEIAWAIQDHYAPQGPNDNLPGSPYGVIASLADKIDALVGFFAIGEKPTSSKDPFALRRAALGVIRLILEYGLRLPLRTVFLAAFQPYQLAALVTQPKMPAHLVPADRQASIDGLKNPSDDLLTFFADRLKVHLREKEEIGHDRIAAAFAVDQDDDLVRLRNRAYSIVHFLNTPAGSTLLTAYRRASNIVRIEEVKDKMRYTGEPDPKMYMTSEETDLDARLREVQKFFTDALREEAFEACMVFLASTLRRPVDEFFTKVTVNCDDADLRANRLRLLARIRDTMNRVADFSVIEG